LVASNAEQASTKAGELLSRLQTIDTTTLSPEALEKWSAHKKSLERSTQTLKAAQKLEEKRVQFEGLSETMYAMVTDFGTSSTLYKQYCPMALNDKGAFWLSAQSDIKNPYFGDAMLTCGEVQKHLHLLNNSKRRGIMSLLLFIKISSCLNQMLQDSQLLS
jgi:Cu(I)/Ag(I) efflux system membrane fusion protein